MFSTLNQLKCAPKFKLTSSFSYFQCYLFQALTLILVRDGLTEFTVDSRLSRFVFLVLKFMVVFLRTKPVCSLSISVSSALNVSSTIVLGSPLH